MDDSLINLDRIPTLEEMRKLFRENDFSAATYLEMDYDKLENEDIEFLEAVKAVMNEHWEPLSCEMGLEAPSSYYAKDNPLIAMRDNIENLIAGGVLKLIEEKPEQVDEILDQFMDAPDVDEKVNHFLRNAVETLMQVMDYEEIAKIIQDIPAHEDFKLNRPQNYRAMDFKRKWDHTRTKTKVESFDDNSDFAKPLPDASADVERTVLDNVAFREFWNRLSEEDRKMVRMKRSGMTHEGIAEKLGYKTHSAVTKRFQKLKILFEKCFK